MAEKEEKTADDWLIGKGLPVLLKSEELYHGLFLKYILETNVRRREPEPLKELRAATANLPMGFMGTAPDAAQLMAMLLKLINAKKTIEIGVYTGYSLLLTALTIPDDGKIIAIDPDRNAYNVGLPIIARAAVEHKIEFMESEGLAVLDELLKHPENEGTFDFAFVDADKPNYINYHERLMSLLKPGGLVVYDNTILGGYVAMAEDSVPGKFLYMVKAARKFNEYLATDARVEICQVPLGDGVTICRRL